MSVKREAAFDEAIAMNQNMKSIKPSPGKKAKMSTGKNDQKLMSIEDVATYLNVPVRTIYAWRSTNKGPRGIRVGRHVRYRSADVEAWIEAQSD